MFSEQDESVQNPNQRMQDRSDERGAVLAEYGLILMLVAFVALGVMIAFGGAVLDLYTDNSSKLSAAVDAVIQN